MINKERALEILHKNMQNQNLRRHCYAVGFAMGGIYDHLSANNKLENGVPERDVWEVLGFLHDADYELTKDDWKQHTLLTLNWLSEEGITNEDPLYLAIQSHNNKVTGLREPQTQMEWALECCDELTGFIVACALVTPEKKLESVKLESIKKKWKMPAFAKGVDRSQIEQCEDRLGVPIDDFIVVVRDAMVANASELGL